MEIGDTFLLIDKAIDEHLWIVVSLPQDNPDSVVIVNLTSHESYKDQSCVLAPADHPWIKHQSCVSYRDAKCPSEAELDSLVASGRLVQNTKASDVLLGKLLIGASLTENLPNKCLKVLNEQGLIDS